MKTSFSASVKFSVRWAQTMRSGVRLSSCGRTPALFPCVTQYRSKSDVASAVAVQPFSAIPGPRSLPLIGNALDVLRHKHGVNGLIDVIADYHKKYGSICKMTMAGTDIVLLFDPASIEEVFRKEGAYPRITRFPALDKIYKTHFDRLAGNMFMSDGEYWKKLRSVVQKKILPPQAAKSFIDILHPVMDDASAAIGKQKTGDIDPLLNKLTLESISAILYGRRLGCLSEPVNEQALKFIRAVKDLLSSTWTLSIGIPWWKISASLDPTYRLCERAWLELIDLGMNEVNELRTRMEKEDPSALASVGAFLLTSAEISPQEASANMLSLMSAGVDTTSSAMMWALYHLAKNPKQQQLLREELTEVLSGRNPSKDDLERLPFLKGVARETYRLTPTALGVTRHLNEDTVIQGYTIPKDTQILLFHHISARNPAIFEHPDEFDPARWSRDDRSKRKTDTSHDAHLRLDMDNPFVQFPFSRGPRMCPGARIAETELFLLLSRLVQDYSISFQKGFSGDCFQYLDFVSRPFPTPMFQFDRL